MNSSRFFLLAFVVLFMAGCSSSRKVSEKSHTRVDWGIDHRVDALFDSVWRAHWNGRGEWEWVAFDCTFDTLRKPGCQPRLSFTRLKRSSNLSATAETVVSDSLSGGVSANVAWRDQHETDRSRELSSPPVSGPLTIAFLIVVILVIYHIKRR